MEEGADWVGPTDDEWGRLYAAGRKLWSSKGWGNVHPNTLFAVVDPVGGETVLCNLPCQEGGERDIMAYLGDDGLRGLEAELGGGSSDSAEVLQAQSVISATRGDRNRLEEEDLAVIERLGLGFRGRRAWPIFRRFRPGYYPWFLAGREARLMTVVMEQAAMLVGRTVNEPDLLLPGDDILTRVPGDAGWMDEWRPLSMPPPPEPPVQPLDRARLERALASSPRLPGAWEMDVFRTRTTLGSGRGPPYFPRVASWVEQDTGRVLNERGARGPDGFPELVAMTVDLIEEQGAPMAIMVQRDLVGDLLEPLAEAAGIALIRVGRLDGIDRARRILEEDMLDDDDDYPDA